MKRLHVHVSVDDLEHAIRFYAGLFAAAPVVLKPDYAKWLLDDPRVNFAISQRGGKPGVEHLGIQVERADERAEMYGRLVSAGVPIREEGDTTCCYARSEKAWVQDPAGVSWEVFHTFGESTVYGGAEEAAIDGLRSTAAAADQNCGCPGMAPPPQPDVGRGCCAPA